MKNSDFRHQGQHGRSRYRALKQLVPPLFDLARVRGEILRQRDLRLLALDRGHSIVGKTIHGSFSDPPHSLNAGLRLRRTRFVRVISSLTAR